MSSLTIIIPAFNEERSILNTVLELQENVKKEDWKILVVNDGSTDSTGTILKDIANIDVIEHPYNKGYGASLKTGIMNADSELIALYDADGQHRPEDLTKLYHNLGYYDMLIGKRGKDSYHGWIRKPGKWILSKVANFLTGTKIPDLNSGLRIIKRDIIFKMLHLFPDGFSFSTTSTIAFLNMGFNVGYEKIIVDKRVGDSTVRQLKHGSNTILLILRLIVLFNPLKVFLPASLVFFIIGIIYEILFGIMLIEGIKLISGAFFMITFIFKK